MPVCLDWLRGIETGWGQTGGAVPLEAGLSSGWGSVVPGLFFPLSFYRIVTCIHSLHHRAVPNI